MIQHHVLPDINLTKLQNNVAKAAVLITAVLVLTTEFAMLARMAMV